MENFKKHITIIFLAMLGGCSTQRIHTIIICPKIEPYSITTQREAKKEIEDNSAPVLSKMIEDYGALRNKIRICSGHLTPNSKS